MIVAKLTIRPLHSPDDYVAFESIQKEIWGPDLAEVISGSMASIVQKIGGICAGAFSETGEMLGCVFGFTGYKDGVALHWSHLLAVKEKERNSGIGRQLKLYQREALLQVGVKDVYWTYEPLVAKNAFLNYNVLGAKAVEYVADMYGPGNDSELFRGIGTDRFIVRWCIASDGVAGILSGHMPDPPPDVQEAPIIVARDVPSQPDALPEIRDLVQVPRIRIEVPPDIHSVRNASASAAVAWRQTTRKAFQFYLSAGYAVTRFVRDSGGRFFYYMEAKG